MKAGSQREEVGVFGSGTLPRSADRHREDEVGEVAPQAVVRPRRERAACRWSSSGRRPLAITADRTVPVDEPLASFPS